MRWLLLALVGGLALGCGDSVKEDDDEDDGEVPGDGGVRDDGGAPVDTLNCAWLEGNNCWKMTLAGAASCLPAVADTGVLAADGRTCTYATGHVVTFDEPVVLPVSTDQDVFFPFTLTTNGQACLRFVETASSMTVTVGGQTFQESSNGLGMQITCPDGSSVSNDNAFDLLECGGDLLSSLALLPGYTWSSSDFSVSFGLLGYSEEEFQVFSCGQ